MSFLTIGLFLALALLLPTVYASWIGAPYAPTRLAAVRKAFDLIKLGGKDTLVDLGAGDGGILRLAAQRQAKAHGYELSPILWLVAKVRTWGYSGIRLTYKNFYKADLSEATVIFIFLMPQVMERVRAFLQAQTMPQGRYMLAYAFPLGGDFAPLQVIREKNCAPLYIYDIQEMKGTSQL